MNASDAPTLLVLIAVVLALYVWNALARPRRPAPPRPIARPARPAPLAPTLDPAPVEPSVAVAPAPPHAAPGPPDPADPLVQRIDALAARLPDAFAVVDALPATLDDRVTMRAALMAAGQALDLLRAGVRTAAPDARAATSAKLDRIERQIAATRAGAERLAASYASLAALYAALPPGAERLRRRIAALASAASFPVALSRSGPRSADAIARIARLPALADARTHDAIKRRLLHARSLLDDIAAGRQALAAATAQREQVVALLASPELAPQPEWWRAIALLCRRTTSAAPASALAADADALLERRRALTADLDPAGDGYRLDEADLGRIVAEAAALQRDVRALWQRARAIAAAPPEG